MEKATYKTEYVLIRAAGDHPMDYIDFALIHVTEEWKKTMLQRLGDAEKISRFKEAFPLIFPEAPMGFYQSDVDTMDMADFLTDEEEWTYVKLTSAELKELDKGHGDLNYKQLCIDPAKDCKAYYRATDMIDCYQTAYFDISEVCKEK